MQYEQNMLSSLMYELLDDTMHTQNQKKINACMQN